MGDDLKSIVDTFWTELAGASTTAEFEALRVKYLGKKGIVSEKFKLLSSATAEEKKSLGKAVNELKVSITQDLASRTESLKADETRKALLSQSLDITLPGKAQTMGRLHPVPQILERICAIFTDMGFGVEEGPEVETDLNNFEALNIPRNHPARDMQDTFYVSEDVVLRTHTSPVQIRAMMKLSPPFRIIAPGKVYRHDSDMTHTPMFHQVEGLMVGDDISFSQLKGILEVFIHKYFGPDIPVRFRPSFFPFTEPSAEVDMGCIFCKSKGCRVCKTTGWIEIMGAGMVNPRVFEMVNYDPAKITGYAFGMGIERIAMLTYGIDDIRMIFENDIRFLRQF
jgi:phenylalanyl-tRNA synthetase alpha chain